MRKREIELKEIDIDIDVDQELLDLEDEVLFQLEDYDVEFPSESEMMMTIDAIRPYVPEKENKWKSFYENVAAIVTHSAKEVFHISPIFWIANSLLLLISIVAMLTTEIDPYSTILFLAPLPTITGILEVLKSKQSGMAELEMSFKFNWQELMLSKMVVIGSFNVFVNIVFTIFISVLLPDIMIWKVLLYWLTPFTVISAFSLMIVSKYRQIHMVTGAILLWIAGGAVVTQTNVIEKIDQLPSIVYILIIVVSVSISAIQMIQIYKRGISYEFNH